MTGAKQTEESAFERCLGRGQFRDRNAQRRTANVVQTDAVTELDAGRLTAMFTTNTEMDIGTGRTAFSIGDLDQLANTRLIENLERVGREDILFEIIVDEPGIIVAADTVAGLCKVVRSEREEPGALGDFVGGQRGTRNFDHRADHGS